MRIKTILSKIIWTTAKVCNWENNRRKKRFLLSSKTNLEIRSEVWRRSKYAHGGLVEDNIHCDSLKMLAKAVSGGLAMYLHRKEISGK